MLLAKVPATLSPSVTDMIISRVVLVLSDNKGMFEGFLADKSLLWIGFELSLSCALITSVELESTLAGSQIFCPTLSLLPYHLWLSFRACRMIHE